MKIAVFLLLLAVGLSRPQNSWASAVLQPRTQSAFALRQKTLHVDAEITGDFVRTQETMVFANPLNGRAEADFTYSAPEGALICGFAYWYGEEKVVARVVEKRRSEELYQLITRPSRDPALVEMLGKNRFRARIFPVMAGADLKVEVHYLQTLRPFPQQKSARWSFDVGSETQAPLDSIEIVLRGDAAKRLKQSNFLERVGDTLRFATTQFTGKEVINVDLSAPAVPIRGTVAAFRQNPNDGFFAIALSCHSTVTNPHPQFQGGGVHDVLSAPIARLRVGETLLVTGRYRQGGRAVISLGARSFAFDLPSTATKSDASLWWASAKMSALDKDERLREASMSLSMRFGIPCRWTNWLAIPEAERKTFEQLLVTTRYNETLRHYAQAVALGNAPRAATLLAQVQQLHHQLKFNGEPDIKDYLRWELERLIAAQQSVQNPVVRARYVGYERNLRKRGVITYQEQAQRAQKATAQAKGLKQRVFGLLENGQTEEAKALDQQAEQTLNQAPSSRYLVREWALARGIEIASGIWKERRAGVADSARQQNLLARLSNLAPATNQKDSELLEIARSNLYYDDWQQLVAQLRKQITSGDEDKTKLDEIRARMAVIKPLITRIRRDEYDEYGYSPSDRTQQLLATNENGAYAELAYELGRQYIARLQAGERDEPATLALREQLERAVARSEGSYGAPKDAQITIDLAWVRVLQQENAALGLEIARGKANSPRAKEIRWRIAQAFSLGAKKRVQASYVTEISRSDYISRAWRARAHETAYRLLEARRKQDSALATLLQQRLEEEAAYSVYEWENRSLPPNEFLKWEQKRIDRKEPLLSAEEYFLHPGDPLISVTTPYNCRRVVAITPDGQVLKLTFDAKRKVWEARFDVPVGQNDGPYTVRVIVVEESGKRHELTLRYNLDTTPATANAQIMGTDKDHRIEVQSDGSGDRAHAILPWGERLELPRGPEGIFGALFSLPEGEQGGHEPIKIVVTDAAHNRTELWTQWK